MLSDECPQFLTMTPTHLTLSVHTLDSFLFPAVEEVYLFLLKLILLSEPCIPFPSTSSETILPFVGPSFPKLQPILLCWPLHQSLHLTHVSFILKSPLWTPPPPPLLFTPYPFALPPASLLGQASQELCLSTVSYSFLNSFH